MLKHCKCLPLTQSFAITEEVIINISFKTEREKNEGSTRFQPKTVSPDAQPQKKRHQQTITFTQSHIGLYPAVSTHKKRETDYKLYTEMLHTKST